MIGSPHVALGRIFERGTFRQFRDDVDRAYESDSVDQRISNVKQDLENVPRQRRRRSKRQEEKDQKDRNSLQIKEMKIAG